MKTIQYLALIFTSLLGQAVYATTVEKLTFEELVEISEIIVEADVESVSLFNSGKLVYTRVLLKVRDTLKGDQPGEFVELDFLGGQQGGNSVTVSGQDIPAEGEHGFYFIENSTSSSVNPLTGWSQGHFKISSDLKGNEYLETDVKQELVELSDKKEGSKNEALAEKLRQMKFSRSLVEKAYFTPVSPDELRDAVAAFLVTD